MKNPFSELTKKEWILYLTSLVVVLASNFFASEINIINMIGTAFGVTALIFIAKGNVFGQFLMVIFGTLYSISALRFRYYSELITYLGMTVPLSITSIVTWLKNPSDTNKNQVKIRKFTVKELILSLSLTVVVTIIFFFVLRALNTPNLIVSTISISTSFFASFLMQRRIAFYAIGFVFNDIVLIVLWTISSFTDLTSLAMVACFTMFLINDIHGFTKWTKREKEQNLN